jgi:hypothetical protein
MPGPPKSLEIAGFHGIAALKPIERIFPEGIRV